MCTAVSFLNQDFYFGRTLDLEGTYGEEIVITPRNFSLPFRHGYDLDRHYAIIGIAHVRNGYPLYYDGANEAGLCMAGLNFPGYAKYLQRTGDHNNVATFEFLPWILGQCATVPEACDLLKGLRLTEDPFSPDLPTTELHWIIADRAACIVVEPRESGIQIHENPVGVLTNSPPFEDQLISLKNHMHLSPNPAHNHFSQKLDLKPYSRGMGAMGLPGDLSSQSRFVRAAFTKLNSICEPEESVSQFFHIMDIVSQTKGCCRLPDGSCEITQYTSCCNASRGIYYYTTYLNRRILGVDMHQENMDGENLLKLPLVTEEDIHYLNG